MPSPFNEDRTVDFQGGKFERLGEAGGVEGTNGVEGLPRQVFTAPRTGRQGGNASTSQKLRCDQAFIRITDEELDGFTGDFMIEAEGMRVRRPRLIDMGEPLEIVEGARGVVHNEEASSWGKQIILIVCDSSKPNSKSFPAL